MTSISPRSTRTLAVLTILSAGAVACSGSPGEAQGADVPPDSVFTEVVGLFREDRMAEAVALLQDRTRAEPRDAGSHALLGHVYHHLQTYPEGVRMAEEALRMAPCSSYAHVVLSILYNPMHVDAPHTDAETSWRHAREAVECDEGDGNAWLSVYIHALERGDEALASRALRRLHELEFFAADVLAYNRWMLESLPPRAILLTNGDLDTFPALALQAALGVRPDVVVVNTQLLNLPWYAERLGRMHRIRFERPVSEVMEMKIEVREGGAGVFPANRIVEGWRLLRRVGALDRDVAFATSADPDLYEHGPGALRNAGAYRILDPRVTEDRTDERAVEAALAAARAEDFVGPGTSPGDRSLVRNAYRFHGGIFPFMAALELAELRLDAGRTDEARRTLAWLNAFAAVATLGEPHLAELEALRGRVQGERAPPGAPGAGTGKGTT